MKTGIKRGSLGARILLAGLMFFGEGNLTQRRKGAKTQVFLICFLKEKIFSRPAFRAFAALFFLGAQLAPTIVLANPTDGQVVAGGATIDQAGSSLTVNQSTDKVIINWQDFSIGAGELTKFIQPSATSAALNRVVGDNLSSIYGTLQANGQVYLINPNGIVVGASGVINTGGFVASTHDVANEEFLNGSSLNFSGSSTAAITNLGSISANGGNIFLIANTLKNEGSLQASGIAGIGAGQDVLLTEGIEKILVRPNLGASGQVENKGLIEAAQVELKAAAGNVYALAIKNQGTVRATGSTEVNGRIFLTAENSSIINEGTVQVSGGTVSVITESLVNTGSVSVVAPEDAGTIDIKAGQVAQLGKLDAGSTAGKGGTVSIEVEKSYFDTISSEIKTDGATEGGKIEVLSDEINSQLYVSGKWSATASEGQGGEIKASAENTYMMGARLDVSGQIGGGRLLVGGDWQGGGDFAESQNTVINPTAVLKADALENGDGGTVVVWSEGGTNFFGGISAKGGTAGGDGGQVEVSGLGGGKLPWAG